MENDTANAVCSKEPRIANSIGPADMIEIIVPLWAKLSSKHAFGWRRTSGQLYNSGLHLRFRLKRPVIRSALQCLEPTAPLRNRDGNTFDMQSLADRLEHFPSKPTRNCNFCERSSSIASPYASAVP